jgi:hypothetical protein
VKRTSIRRISQKRWAKIPERQNLRAVQLAQSPRCEAALDDICEHRAVDVHEIVNRSQRSTSWLEPDLFVSLCRPCHRWVTAHPLWSKKHGYTLSNWQAKPYYLDAARRARQDCTDPRCTDDHLERRTPHAADQ